MVLPYSILEMKPRNKKEEAIVQLSEKLPPLNAHQIEYAKTHIFPMLAYRNKISGWCTHCGSELKFERDSKAKYVVCPHCGQRLQIECNKVRKDKFKAYFTVVTTIGGYQVVRHFFCSKKIRKHSSPEYEIDEVVQNWISENGKETIIARSTISFTQFYDYWNLYSELSIKNRGGYYSMNGTRYDIDNTVIYPHVSLLKKVRRNSLKSLKEFDFVPANRLLSFILSDRETEILVKHNQKSLIAHKIRTSYRNNVEPLKHSEAIRIACRHKYIVNDASLWLDYVSLLEHFGLDVHNPHYVCPLDLHEAHARLLARKNREDAKIEKEKLIEEAKQYEASYQIAKAPFFGIVFGNENIVITVVQSVAEMATEGAEMHHCVFSMKYFNNEKSLILSAKDKKGNRIETIEVNLDTFKVVQSRGVCNKNSAYHDQIVKLVEDNMHLIRKVA